MWKRSTSLLICLVLAVPLAAQEATPTPGPSAVDQLQEQIDLLKKQKEYEKARHDLETARLNEILDRVKRTGDEKQETGKTEFQDAAKATAEASALSYAALQELSVPIAEAVDPAASRYSAIIIYNEPDFLSLAKFRLYDRQSLQALADYNAWRAKISGLAARERSRPTPLVDKSVSIAGIETILSLPTIATGFAASVGDLLSLFRTESKVYQSYGTVDADSLGTALARELGRRNARLKIYFPGAFLPEYDLAGEAGRSILWRVSDVNAANLWTYGFMLRSRSLSASEQARPEVRAILDEGKVIQDELRALAVGDQKVGDGPRRTEQPGNDDEEAEPGKVRYTDLRALIRGEKLDGYMRQGAQAIGSDTGPRVGILKVRSLASGGSLKETRNIFFGNKIRYSGSVTVEVQIFDVDGTLRSSDIFSGHTGFRKLDKLKK